MSGILGFTASPPWAPDSDRLERALRLLQHRGLDERAVFFFDTSGHPRRITNPASQNLPPADLPKSTEGLATAMLAHCCTRTEAHDPSKGSSDPAKGGQTFLAFDGVLDNGPELARELQDAGCKIECDSRNDQILLAAFERWGVDCLSRVTGSFALTVIDLRRRTLILARDAFGTRPLYYLRQNGRLFFASHLGALLEFASVPRRVNRSSLYRYLVHNVMDHGTQTFFEDVAQVPAAHFLRVALDEPIKTSLMQYRHASLTPNKLTFDEAAEHVRELVTRSVVAQVGAHTSAGAAISGGFDSSFVVAAFLRAQIAAELKLYTCVPTVRNGEFSRSEQQWAELAATYFGKPIRRVLVGSDGLPENLASLVRLQEEPFSSPVVYAQLQVFRVAEEDGVKVMLSGQGGDTLFAASSQQVLRAAAWRILHLRWGQSAGILRARLRQDNIGQLTKSAIRMMIPPRLAASAKRWRRPTCPDWLNAKWFELDAATEPDEFGLPMLRLEDRGSVASLILNRMPLLTAQLQDFVRSLPAHYLARADQPLKALESAAMRGMVPDALLARRERFGFPVPVREWLDELAPWVDKKISETEHFPFLQSRRVRYVWESFRNMNRSEPAAFLVWRWIFLAAWLHYCSVRLD